MLSNRIVVEKFRNESFKFCSERFYFCWIIFVILHEFREGAHRGFHKMAEVLRTQGRWSDHVAIKGEVFDLVSEAFADDLWITPEWRWSDAFRGRKKLCGECEHSSCEKFWRPRGKSKGSAW